MNRYTTVGFGPGKPSEGVKWIIIVTVAIWIIQQFNSTISAYLVLYPLSTGLFLPWQLVTHMFAHGGPFHLLFNMLMVWMFGTTLEREFGLKKFLLIYFISGVGTGIVHFLFFDYPVLGASAAVYGLMTAFAYFWPNAVLYVFGIIPLKARTLVIILIVFGLFMGMNQARDNIAHFAHVLGAVIAFIYLQIAFKKYSLFGSIGSKIQEKSGEFSDKMKSSKKEKVVYKEDWTKQKVDELLEKVSKHGINSLTRKEKDFLDRVSSDFNSKDDF